MFASLLTSWSFTPWRGVFPAITNLAMAQVNPLGFKPIHGQAFSTLVNSKMCGTIFEGFQHSLTIRERLIVDDTGKGVRVEGGAAHKHPVNVGLMHQFVNGAGFYGTAILNGQLRTA